MLSDLLKFRILSQKYVMELLHGSTVPNMTMYNICILFVDQEFLKVFIFCVLQKSKMAITAGNYLT